MPYENEHSCRLEPPKNFLKFRRGKRKHNGKEYFVIFGQPKDGTGWREQAYRYNKDTWTASEARSHCKEHGGRFEAATERDTFDNILDSIFTSFCPSCDETLESEPGRTTQQKEPSQEGESEFHSLLRKIAEELKK